MGYECQTRVVCVDQRFLILESVPWSVVVHFETFKESRNPK